MRGNLPFALERADRQKTLIEPDSNGQIESCKKGEIRARFTQTQHQHHINFKKLKKPVIEKAQMTFGGHLEDLKALRDAAASVEQFGQATTTRSQQD